MESLYFLIPGALIFIAVAIKVLFWAINSGQYDNLDTEAHRILFDDEAVKPTTEKPQATTQDQQEKQKKEKQEKEIQIIERKSTEKKLTEKEQHSEQHKHE